MGRVEILEGDPAHECRVRVVIGGQHFERAIPAGQWEEWRQAVAGILGLAHQERELAPDILESLCLLAGDPRQRPGFIGHWMRQTCKAAMERVSQGRRRTFVRAMLGVLADPERARWVGDAFELRQDDLFVRFELHGERLSFLEVQAARSWGSRQPE